MNKLACALSLLFAVIIFGCSGSSGKNPVEPNSEFKNQSAIQSNRHLWGIWDITIDADRTMVEITPVRGADMHLNVVKLLEGKACASCLKVSNIKITGPNELSADLTLTHPYPGLPKYTGFDVRGIFISQADYTFATSGRTVALGDTVPRLLDPDGYTSLFNPTEFPPTVPAALGYIAGKHATGGDLSSTLNPFIAYRKNAPRRMFEAGGTETKTVNIHTPTGPIHFGYAVDVCWQLTDNVIDPVTDFPPDANCLEAYAMSIDTSADLFPIKGCQAIVQVVIYDHQGSDTISSVTIEAPDLFTGTTSLAFSTAMPDGGFLFAGTVSNDFSEGVGKYPVLIKSTDTQVDQNLGEIDAWQVAYVTIRNGWARTWGGSGGDAGESVATDSFGNSYVTGFFMDTVDFDPGAGVDNHTSNGSVDIFLGKFDPMGNFVWARTWGGIQEDCGISVAIDGSENVYVTGIFRSTVDFDPGPGVDNHETQTDSGAFLSKFDSNGNYIWARTWGETSYCWSGSVTIDSSDNIYLTGSFMGTVDFDPGANTDNHEANGSQDIFLSKLDSNGNFAWARTWGGPTSADFGASVAVDGSGNAYITGCFCGTADFDPGAGEDSHTASGLIDIFLSKFDQNGSFVWARTWGGSTDALSVYEEGCSVKIDGSGNLYTGGYYYGTADFDPGAGVDNHMSNGETDIFLSKLDSNGNFIWARTWGGLYFDNGCSVAINGSNDVFTAGVFSGTADFDPGAGIDIHTSNMADTFLSKFDLNGNFIWARTWGGPGAAMGISVATDGSGNAFVTGEYFDIVDFDPGPGVDNHTSNGYDDAFLARFPPDGNW